MKQLSIQLTYHQYHPNESGLSASDCELIALAKKATERSYAPYSQFHVGAALRLSSGKVVCGSNQENAAYPTTICAERTALHYAATEFPDDFPVAIAIAAWRESDGLFLAQPISPCGTCRQALLETEHRYKSPIRVLLYGEEAIYEIDSASQLLPLQFCGDAL